MFYDIIRFFMFTSASRLSRPALLRRPRATRLLLSLFSCFLGCECFPLPGVRSADDWYGVSKENILEAGGVGFVAAHLSLPAALERLFPHLGLFPWKFKQVPKVLPILSESIFVIF